MMPVRDRVASNGGSAHSYLSRKKMRGPESLWVCLGVPVVGSAVLLLLASVFPLRLDQRSFQGVVRIQGLVEPARPVVFLSSDNGADAAEIAAYALPHLLFPNGAARWLTLHESTRGFWTGGFLAVDSAGHFWTASPRSRGWEWVSAGGVPAWLPRSAAEDQFLYDRESTRVAFEQRLPILQSARRVAVVRGRDQIDTLPRRGFHLELSFARWLRLASLLGCLAAAVVLIGAGREPAHRLVAGAVAAGWALAILVGAVYLVNQASPHLGLIVPFLGWAGGTVLAFRRGVRGRLAVAVQAAVLVGVVLYAGLLLARLDFDGDTYTTYLHIARSEYLRGYHEPRAPEIQRVVQGSAYPPGYPSLLALALWAADADPQRSFDLSPEGSLAILVYRAIVVLLNLLLLAALAGFAAMLDPHHAAAPVAAVLGALLVAPTLRGQHIAAETFLVPIVGLALVAVGAAAARRDPVLRSFGLFLAAFAAFVKLEGAVDCVFLVLPLAVTAWPQWTRRDVVASVLALTAGVAPFVAWKTMGAGSNLSFESSVAWTARMAVLPDLVTEGMKLGLRSEIGLVLGVLLPAAAWAQFRRSEWRALIVPMAIVAITAFWFLVYTQSTLGPVNHLQTSFLRLMTLPGLAGLLYALEAWSPAVAGRATSA